MSTQIYRQPERTDTESYASALEELNKKMQRSADAAVAFAPPQTLDGLTVIPVAKVRSRFGSGVGMGKPRGQESVQRDVGTGGTLSVIPVGYIELKEGRARFRPIFTPDALVRMQAMGGTLALLTLAVVGALFGRGRRSGGGLRRRGPVYNVAFSPGANIIAGGGRSRRRRSLQPPRAGHEKRARVEFPRRVSARARFPRIMRLARSKAQASA